MSYTTLSGQAAHLQVDVGRHTKAVSNQANSAKFPASDSKVTESEVMDMHFESHIIWGVGPAY
jgi:hypothetical protein